MFVRVQDNSGSLAFEKAVGGDEAAFGELVRQHQAMVFSIALHFLRNRAVAEELAQDVFLHLFKTLKEIESPVHLTNWLRRVTSHRCIDQSRQQKYRPRVGLEAAPEPAINPSNGDPMLQSMLDRLVRGLPEKPRMIVILRYQEELEPGEIAEILSIPLGTVKSILHRALAVLRGKMEREQKGARS